MSLPHRTTYADYIAAEQNSERRHEFIDGVIVAMAGGSDEHNAIAGRFAGCSQRACPTVASITHPISDSGSQQLHAVATATGR